MLQLCVSPRHEGEAVRLSARVNGSFPCSSGVSSAMAAMKLDAEEEATYEATRYRIEWPVASPTILVEKLHEGKVYSPAAWR